MNQQMPTGDAIPPRRHVAEINELTSHKRTNRWIPWIQIREFSVRNGLTAGRLCLTLADGRSVKFLWKRDSKVSGLLRDVLDERVGRR